MRANTFKDEIQQSNKTNLFSKLENFFRLGSVAENGLPIRLLPIILFITTLVIFYIGNNHYAEKMIRKIDRLQVEVEDLRADYITLKADYVYKTKQSEVAKRVKPLGLYESLESPQKVIIKKSEH